MAFFVSDSNMGSGDGGSSWSRDAIPNASAGDLLLLAFFGSYAESGTGEFTGPGDGWNLQADLVSRFRNPPSGTGGWWGRLVVWSRLATSSNLGATSGQTAAGSGYGGGFNEYGLSGLVFRKSSLDEPFFVGNNGVSSNAGAGGEGTVGWTHSPGTDALACSIIFQGTGTVSSGWTSEQLTPSGNTLALGRLFTKEIEAAGEAFAITPSGTGTHRAFYFNLADRRTTTTRRARRGFGLVR